jgi:hypothetical protein
MSYTTYTDVAAELGGVTISAGSTPTSTTVEGWIAEGDDEINARTGRVWSSTTVTTASYEYHDYDGGGIIRLHNKPVISVQSVGYNEYPLGETESWVALVEGKDADSNYVLYKDEGLLYLHSNSTGNTPSAGIQNVRITYTYGYSSVPARIKRLSTLLAAKRYIQSVANKTGSEEGGSVSVGTISVSDPNNYVHEHLRGVNREIDTLFKEVANKFRPYLYDIRAYD